MSRYFTLDEAQKLIPEIERLIDAILESKQVMDQANGELQQLNSRINMMGGSMIHPGEILRIRRRKETAGLALKESTEKLESYGCLMKDASLGLVDFPTLYHGQEVHLCWKKGESEIRYWHGLTEGYQGRKPIDEEFIANHRGGVN
jgi:hypothetical protein